MIPFFWMGLTCMAGSYCVTGLQIDAGRPSRFRADEAYPHHGRPPQGGGEHQQVPHGPRSMHGGKPHKA